MGDEATQDSGTGGGAAADAGAAGNISAGLKERMAGKAAEAPPAPHAPASALPPAANPLAEAAQKVLAADATNPPKTLDDYRIADLQKQIAQLTAASTQKDKETADRREAEDVVNDFIRHDKLPPELLRPFLPVTKDRAVLNEARQKVGAIVQRLFKEAAQSGHIKFVNIGGAPRSEGEVYPAEMGKNGRITELRSNTAFDNIAAGLSGRKHQQVVHAQGFDYRDERAYAPNAEAAARITENRK